MQQLSSTNFFARPGNPVEKVFYGRTQVQAAGSAFYFVQDGLVQRLLQSLKYQNNQSAGIWLGALMGTQLQQSGRFNQVTTIVPVPLNAGRLQQRGYNQAELLAQGISGVCGWPVNATAVVRDVHTGSQTKQGRINRWQNMQQVFSLANASSLYNQHILLVDDVLTTGATLEACGNTLLAVPGSRLSIATAAFTVK
ncbi:ComF family protein [Deminuibacter soli]|uniref:ComF family protein n=2 Tax=Deminuibacter soli TaxID=2291815 RepID=A0A3E1ND25_9BACT|nr:ComF family protein [Deminuibacter soli]